MQPHRRQPTRLPCPWDSPGKNTGVGCHFLLQYMKVKSESEVAQSCPTLSDPMDCSLLSSSIHGIFQARVLEWGAIAFSIPGGASGKESICSAGTTGDVGSIPGSSIPRCSSWKRQPTLVFLPRQSHEQKCLVGCSSGDSNGSPLQYSCLENPMDREAWKAAVHGVAKSQTRLSDFNFTFHFHALEKEMATHSSVLAWRIPGTGEPGGLPSLGSHRVGHN